MQLKDLLKEKFNNMFKFLKEKFPEALVSVVAEYEKINTTFIAEYIKIKILPKKHLPDEIITELCAEHKIDQSKLAVEDLEKIKKYISCFCELVEKM